MAKAEITVHIADLPTVKALTTALRAVLAYCDQVDHADFFPGLADTDAIRSAITTAMEGRMTLAPTDKEAVIDRVRTVVQQWEDDQLDAVALGYAFEIRRALGDPRRDWSRP